MKCGSFNATFPRKLMRQLVQAGFLTSNDLYSPSHSRLGIVAYRTQAYGLESNGISNPVDYSSGAATDSHRTSLLSGIKCQHLNRIRHKFYMKNYFGCDKKC